MLRRIIKMNVGSSECCIRKILNIFVELCENVLNNKNLSKGIFKVKVIHVVIAIIEL